DDDRRPWLRAVRRRVDEAAARGENVVLACSALKHAYQEYLQSHAPESIRYVYLTGSEDLIRRRMAARKGHFMDPGLLHSPVQTLAPPGPAIQADITPPPEAIAAQVRRQLGL